MMENDKREAERFVEETREIGQATLRYAEQLASYEATWGQLSYGRYKELSAHLSEEVQAELNAMLEKIQKAKDGIG